MTKRLDERRLQRLVDGMLNDEERQAFLAEADQHPSWWRGIALAFVEEHSMSQSISIRIELPQEFQRQNSRK